MDKENKTQLTKQQLDQAFQTGYRCGCVEGYRRGYWDGVHRKREEEISSEILEYPVRYLNISNRVEARLRLSLRCNCIRDVLYLDEDQIRCGRGVGLKAVEEVVRALKELDIPCPAWENCAYFLKTNRIWP